MSIHARPRAMLGEIWAAMADRRMNQTLLRDSETAEVRTLRDSEQNGTRLDHERDEW